MVKICFISLNQISVHFWVSSVVMSYVFIGVGAAAAITDANEVSARTFFPSHTLFHMARLGFMIDLSLTHIVE